MLPTIARVPQKELLAPNLLEHCMMNNFTIYEVLSIIPLCFHLLGDIFFEILSGFLSSLIFFKESLKTLTIILVILKHSKIVRNVKKTILTRFCVSFFSHTQSKSKLVMNKIEIEMISSFLYDSHPIICPLLCTLYVFSYISQRSATPPMRFA